MKEGVHRAGVGRVVADLEGQLRSASVPAPLRWAAQRLAGLIRRDAPAADAVVSFDAAIDASDAASAVAAPVPQAPGAHGATSELRPAEQSAAEPAMAGAAGSSTSAKTAAKPAAAVPLGSGRTAARARASKSVAPAAGGSPATRPPHASSMPGAGVFQAPQGKKAPTTSEKDAVKVAAGPMSSKTPARSVASSGRPAAKRPVAKAAKKRD